MENYFVNNAYFIESEFYFLLSLNIIVWVHSTH